MADRITPGKAQIQGRRKEQQDALGFICQDDGGVVAVVADGVGGHSHGKAASELAVSVFLRAYQSEPKGKAIPDALFDALHAANNAVCEFAKAKGELENCGTTLTAVAVRPEAMSLHWISVGDSRLYLLRGRQWIQVTVDSNYAGYLRKRTMMEVEAPAEGDEGEDDEPDVELMALTSFLGKPELTEIDRSIRPFALEASDWLVLCTDGLHSALDAGELTGCLSGGPQEACDMLMGSVEAKGWPAQDNATVAILSFQSRERPARRDVPEAQAKPPETQPTMSAKPRSKRLPWLVLAVLAVLALALGAGWLARQKVAEPLPSPPPREAVEAQPPAKAAEPRNAAKPRGGRPPKSVRRAPPAARR